MATTRVTLPCGCRVITGTQWGDWVDEFCNEHFRVITEGQKAVLYENPDPEEVPRG